MYKYTSNTLGILVLAEEQSFQLSSEATVLRVVSQFVWERIPDKFIVNLIFL